MLQPTVSRPVCLGSKHMSGAQSRRQIYFTTGGLALISSSCRQTPWDSRTEIFLTKRLRSYFSCNILSDEEVGLHE
jgi:hypothetical protein